MIHAFARILTVAVAALGVAAAGAQEVRLVSTDRLVELTGRLSGFDGEAYTVETRIGAIGVPADQVICDGAACPPLNRVTSRFRIAGAPALLRFALPEIIDAYSLSIDTDIARSVAPDGAPTYWLTDFEGAPVADIALDRTDAAGALAALAGGTAALAVTSRPITDAEAAALTAGDRDTVRRLGLEHRIGTTGLVAIIGEDIGLDSLTQADLARIFAGGVVRWSELGGPDLPISAFLPPAESDAGEMFDRLVMAPAGLAIGATVISVDSDDAVRRAVASFSNGIGITAFRGSGGAQTLAIPDACGTPVAPDPLAMKSGRYPLAGPIHVYEAPGAVPVHGRAMLDFLAAPSGQRVLAATGFVDLPTEPDAATDAAQCGDD